jgi:hypothetical protein
LNSENVPQTLSGRWIDKVRQRVPLKGLILDMDSSVSETYGRVAAAEHRHHALPGSDQGIATKRFGAGHLQRGHAP